MEYSHKQNEKSRKQNRVVNFNRNKAENTQFDKLIQRKET